MTIHNPGTVRTTYGTALAISVTASSSAGRAITYGATGLPVGLKISVGKITGTPTKAGTHLVTVVANDGIAKAQLHFVITILSKYVPNVAPKVAGTLRVGHTVRINVVSWHLNSSAGATVRPAVHYQWYANGHAIRGASKAHFRIPRSDRGKHLRAKITIGASSTVIGYSHTTGRTSAVR